MKKKPELITLTEVVNDYLKSFPTHPKKSFMKHIKQLAYLVIQFRGAEFFTLAGILSLASCLITYSFWPLTGTIILPLIGFMIGEQKKYKSTGKY